MSTDSLPDDYAPGHCVIGQTGRTRRGLQGSVGLVVATGYALFVSVATLPALFLVGIFVPLG